MTSTWDETQRLAARLLADPLMGMEHIAELCSALTALTRHAFNDLDHKYNCLKSTYASLSETEADHRITKLEHALAKFTHLTTDAVGTNRSSLATVHDAIQHLRDKCAEHDTLLADLFGAAPTKLTARVDSLQTTIQAAVAGIAEAEQELQNLKASHQALASRIPGALGERLAAIDARFCRPKTGDDIDLGQRIDKLNAVNIETTNLIGKMCTKLDTL
jgi:chromosome segregation ATPase